MSYEVDATPMLVRRMAWDMLPCNVVEQMMPRLGLTPSHPDVSELEHAESHDRLEELDPVIPYLEVFAFLANEILMKTMGDEQREELGEETVERVAEQNLVIIRSSVSAILSQLVDCNAITVHKGLIYG